MAGVKVAYGARFELVREQAEQGCVAYRVRCWTHHGECSTEAVVTLADGAVLVHPWEPAGAAPAWAQQWVQRLLRAEYRNLGERPADWPRRLTRWRQGPELGDRNG